MTLVEILCCIALAAILMSLAVVNVPGIIGSRELLYGKAELDSFLENARMEAVVDSRRVFVYFRAADKTFSTSTGKSFVDSNILSGGDFRISYNHIGAIAILSGSTTLTYRDGSRLTISPVSGRLGY